MTEFYFWMDEDDVNALIDRKMEMYPPGMSFLKYGPVNIPHDDNIYVNFAKKKGLVAGTFELVKYTGIKGDINYYTFYVLRGQAKIDGETERKGEEKAKKKTKPKKSVPERPPKRRTGEYVRSSKNKNKKAKTLIEDANLVALMHTNCSGKEGYQLKKPKKKKTGEDDSFSDV